jgi:YebC/PmpR family DNA-binding regulatory protein
MPAANIERSIARGAGTAGGAALEELTYEGYGPAGVAIFVKALTDNRNRTASDVKSSFTKYGGNLGAPGSVAYMFEQKGIIISKPNIDKDNIALRAIEVGADDIDDSGPQVIVYTQPAKLEKIRDELGEDNIESAEVKLEPKQTVLVEDEAKAKTLMRLMETLDDLDDVVEVTANFDIPEEILSKLD